MTQRIEPFFWLEAFQKKNDSNNCTFFSVWLEELNFLLAVWFYSWMWLKELNPFSWMWLKKLIFFSVTQRIELFFLNVTQRIECFVMWLKGSNHLFLMRERDFISRAGSPECSFEQGTCAFRWTKFVINSLIHLWEEDTSFVLAKQLCSCGPVSLSHWWQTLVGVPDW